MGSAYDYRLHSEAQLRLAELLSVPATDLKVVREAALNSGKADAVAYLGAQVFVLEGRADGKAASVAMAARQAKEHASTLGQNAVPLVVVPFMGEVGRRVCAEAGVGWLDLSGNARLTAPGLRIHVEGKPNRFIRAGRPRSLFAPKSARIARWLLMKRNEPFTQRQLAKISGLDEGFTSRIVRGMEAEELITRDPDGAVRVADYAALLDALREAYDFSKHHIVRGHVAARSSGDVLRRLSKSLKAAEIEYAVTGLAGAWLWSGFAGFRLVTIFVGELPADNIRQEMGFREIERGENVWLVQPNDFGVFKGSEIKEETSCANPVQVYLDLKDQPERAAEAGEALRQRLLNPTDHV